MTTHPSRQPVSALRARMIEDMSVRIFSEKTRNDYIRNVRGFAACDVVSTRITSITKTSASPTPMHG